MVTSRYQVKYLIYICFKKSLRLTRKEEIPQNRAMEKEKEATWQDFMEWVNRINAETWVEEQEKEKEE